MHCLCLPIYTCSWTGPLLLLYLFPSHDLSVPLLLWVLPLTSAWERLGCGRWFGVGGGRAHMSCRALRGVKLCWVTWEGLASIQAEDW